METLKLLEKKEVLLAKSTYFVRPKRLSFLKTGALWVLFKQELKALRVWILKVSVQVSVVDQYHGQS